jgi:2-iminobutanoate/2-iminopropanoate deaminase
VILEASGSSLDQVVKTTIFLSSMDLFAEVNEAYASYFADAPPARATVAVAGLPKEVEVEIEVVGYC